MTNTKSAFREQLVQTIQLQDELVNNSGSFDPKTKEAMINHGAYWIERLNNEHFTLTQLKSVLNDILTFWKESIGTTTEMFWMEMKKHNIDFERKDELIFALQKGRFRRVDIGIGARKDWNEMKNLESIRNRFSHDEIEKISGIIDLDEKNRLGILKRCLRKKEIPQTQYLKFGECMAYMSDCGLWENHFSEAEVYALNDIWNNFGSESADH